MLNCQFFFSSGIIFSYQRTLLTKQDTECRCITLQLSGLEYYNRHAANTQMIVATLNVPRQIVGSPRTGFREINNSTKSMDFSTTYYKSMDCVELNFFRGVVQSFRKICYLQFTKDSSTPSPILFLLYLQFQFSRNPAEPPPPPIFSKLKIVDFPVILDHAP